MYFSLFQKSLLLISPKNWHFSPPPSRLIKFTFFKDYEHDKNLSGHCASVEGAKKSVETMTKTKKNITEALVYMRLRARLT
jgi:hypothetical protein